MSYMHLGTSLQFLEKQFLEAVLEVLQRYLLSVITKITQVGGIDLLSSCNQDGFMVKENVSPETIETCLQYLRWHYIVVQHLAAQAH